MWRDYTSKLLQLLKTEESGRLMLEESQMLGLIASSQSPEEHLQRLYRYIHWYEIAPTEPKILEIYEEEPDDALERGWLSCNPVALNVKPISVRRS